MDIQQIKPYAAVGSQVNTNLGALSKTAPALDAANSSVPSSETPNTTNPNSVKAVANSVDPTQLNQALDKVNAVVQKIAPELSFSIDEETGIRVVKVTDLATKEVIRQFPSEEVLAIAKSLDKLQGLLVKQTV